MALTIKQKEYLFTNVFDKQELLKYFNSIDIEWLKNQNVILRDSGHGWLDIYMNREICTSINTLCGKEWCSVVLGYVKFETCQWCGKTFVKDDMVTYEHKRVCKSCKEEIQKLKK